MPARRRARPSLKILITAGPTREYLDPVRYLSNDSSGKTGFALAAAARARGHRPTLVHGPVALAAPRGVPAVPVVSAREMLATCRRLWGRHDVLIMTAAVADYAVAGAARTKLKRSARGRVLRLRPNPDIVAALARAARTEQIVIGFALEDRAGRRHARGKLERKGLDAIVLNAPAAIGAERSRVEVLVRGRAWDAWPAMSKVRLAQRLVRRAEELHAAATRGSEPRRGDRR